ncbi:hypothetical protein FRC00_008563 [Tulasnella sp. 408]|nr:hypothetical protein FRC00_008563 [Tulasnella sp. 408]
MSEPVYQLDSQGQRIITDYLEDGTPIYQLADTDAPMADSTGQLPVQTGRPIIPLPARLPVTPGNTQAGAGQGQGSATTQPGEKGKEVAPGQRVSALDLSKGTAPLTLEAIRSLKGTELLKAVRSLKIAPTQEEEKGTLSFPNASHPRCVHTRTLWSDVLADDATATSLTPHIINGHYFTWVNTYRVMQPADAEVNLFMEGLGLAKKYELIKGFEDSEYEIVQAAKACKAFLVICETKAAHTRLHLHRTWTVRMPNKAATFFLSNDESWGSHVIYDVHGGGADFIKDVLPKLHRACGAAITQVKATKPKSIAWKDLAYYQVPHNANTHKGAKGITWRVRWTPTPTACANAWRAPHNIGFTNRGSVVMRHPPMCTHCISYSHGQNLCQWWTEGLVAGSKTRPDHFEDVKWVDVDQITWRKLNVSDDAGPSLTL